MFRLKDGWKTAKISLRSAKSKTAPNKKSQAYSFKYGPAGEKKTKNWEKSLKNALVALFSLVAVFCSRRCSFGVLHLSAACLFVLLFLWGCWWHPHPLSTSRDPLSAIASGSLVLTSSIAVASTRLHLFNAASALGHTAYACSAKFHTRNFSISKSEKKKKHWGGTEQACLPVYQQLVLKELSWTFCGLKSFRF